MFGINPFEAVLILLLYGVWIVIGGYVAQQKRRSVKEGALLGCLGPVGVLIEALLPTKDQQ
ncbi:MAG: hypothetical protein DWH81_11455 [Planctomycetota bacterium]|nr:MAG: hypothetical protein DWH81_11455 [Planctomycetota bacterium]